MSSVNPYNSVTSKSETNVNNINDNTTLGKEDFLKLLVTELQNQDPMEPKDNTQFIAEMAQFSSLEIMNEVAEGLKGLQTELSRQNQQSLLVQGSALIGKNVIGPDINGELVDGIVDSVTSMDGEIKLLIGDKTIKLTDVIQVRPVEAEDTQDTEVTQETNQTEETEEVQEN